MLEVVEGPASLDSSMKIQKEKHQGEEGAFWYGRLQLLEVKKEQVKHCSLAKETGHGSGKLASGGEEHSVLLYLLEVMLERQPDLAVSKWEEKPHMMMQEQGW
jgi:hypothetical protein